MRCDDRFTVNNLGAIAAQQWDKKVVKSYPQVVIGLLTICDETRHRVAKKRRC